MKKDGTRYLCIIEYPNGERDWEVVSWGLACGMSTLSSKDSGMMWIRSGGMAPCIKRIVEFTKLREI